MNAKFAVVCLSTQQENKMKQFKDMMVAIEISDRKLLVAPDTFTEQGRAQDEAESHDNSDSDDAIVKRVALAFSRTPEPTLVMVLNPSQAKTVKGILAISYSVREAGHILSVFNNWAVAPYYKNGGFLLHELDSGAVLASSPRLIRNHYAQVNEKASDTEFFDRLQQFYAWFLARPTTKIRRDSFGPCHSIKPERA